MSEHIMVVGIDFGTTFSGYAFSLGGEFDKDPLKISSNSPWIAGSQGLVSHKTPTCVLLDPDKNFKKFGYEAEDRYNDLAQEGKHRDWYYFRRFKMTLHNQPHLRRDTVIEDESGKPMLAKKVFAMGIEYLKDHALGTINKQGKMLECDDIHWVLTVPAIWSDAAKQFMREAAQSAGLMNNQLSIALEPEAASVYCRYLPVDQLAGSDAKGGMSVFRKGTKYMVIDLGGGTADITVHEVESEGNLHELHGPSGGPWGGTRVDDAFIKYLTDIVGPEVMQEFMTKHMDDALDLFREFEIKKRTVKMDMSETPRMTIKIPVSIYELFEKRHKKSLRDYISKSDKFKDKISCMSDKIRIVSEEMQKLFKVTVDNLVEHIRDILAEPHVRGTSTFILVGGFSESPIIQDTIRRKFANMRVLVPFDAGLAVLKGAVLFGHQPMTITSRVCRLTYGVAVSRIFRKGDPDEKKYCAGGHELCKDAFHKYVEMGAPVKVDEAITTMPYSAAAGQRVGRVRIFSSTTKSPEFVTERLCNFVGELVLSLPEDADKVKVKMIFGGTELSVEATDVNSGNTCKARFDFLSD